MSFAGRGQKMELTDTQLVELCQTQLPYDTTAFEVLLRRYEPLVYRTCRRYLGHDQDAEDACQDALLRVFHALPRFERRSAFRTWLFRVVANVCATRWEKRKRWLTDQAEYLAAVQEQPTAREVPQPEHLDEVTGVIGEGLEMLGPDDRQVLILRHVTGLSFDELAATFEIGLSAAKMRLYRAEQRLRAACERVQSGSQEKSSNV
jgi:RNA polymerase sigma-70 factor (ECF subfamily)